MQASWNHCRHRWHCSIRRYHLESQRSQGQPSPSSQPASGLSGLALHQRMLRQGQKEENSQLPSMDGACTGGGPGTRSIGSSCRLVKDGPLP